MALRALQSMVAPARRTFASLAAADDVSNLAASEVAVKMMAAPITGTASMSGVGVVTAVGSSVKGITVDDHVVSKASIGSFRPVAKIASPDKVVKVPKDIPVEYAALLSAPCAAAQLLKGCVAGDVVVQSGACSLVGQAVVQLCRAKGITSINIVQPGTEQDEMVDLLKSLGGDLVVPTDHAESWRFKALTSDLPTPALAIVHAGPLDDPSLAAKTSAAGGAVSKLRVALAGASEGDLTKLKIASAVKSLGAKRTAAYGPNAGTTGGATFNVAEWFASAPAEEVAATVEDVSSLIKAGDLNLWLEKYPAEDLPYASETVAKSPFPGFRAMVLEF